MSSDPLRMFRQPFAVDVTTAGVQVSGIAPQPVTFGSIDIGPGAAMSPAPAAAPPPPPSGAAMMGRGMAFAPPSAPVGVPPPPPVAGVWEMATSFGASMAKFAGSGFKTVSQQVHDERMAHCNACPHHTGTKCVLCGCFTHAKAWMPHEGCPIQKWLAETQ